MNAQVEHGVSLFSRYQGFAHGTRPDGGAGARPWIDALRQRWACRLGAWKRRRRWRSQIRVLAELDAGQLRDIGVTPGEIESVAAEIVGLAAGTRRRIRVAG